MNSGGNNQGGRLCESLYTCAVCVCHIIPTVLFTVCISQLLSSALNTCQFWCITFHPQRNSFVSKAGKMAVFQIFIYIYVFFKTIIESCKCLCVDFETFICFSQNASFFFIVCIVWENTTVSLWCLLLIFSVFFPLLCLFSVSGKAFSLFMFTSCYIALFYESGVYSCSFLQFYPYRLLIRGLCMSICLCNTKHENLSCTSNFYTLYQYSRAMS